MSYGMKPCKVFLLVILLILLLMITFSKDGKYSKIYLNSNKKNVNKNILFLDLDDYFKKMKLEIDPGLQSEKLDNQMNIKDFSDINDTIISEFRKIGIQSYILNFNSGTKDNSGKFIVKFFILLNIPGKTPLHRDMYMEINGSDVNNFKINRVYSNSVINSSSFLPGLEDVSMIINGISYENISEQT